jgi:hypothetical protein
LYWLKLFFKLTSTCNIVTKVVVILLGFTDQQSSITSRNGDRPFPCDHLHCCEGKTRNSENKWPIVDHYRKNVTISYFPLKLRKDWPFYICTSGLRSLGVTFPPHDSSDAGSNPTEVVEFLMTEKFRELVLREGL